MFKLISIFNLIVLSLSVRATSDEVCSIDSIFAELADEKQLIMFGEIHGTKEMPAYVAKVLCFLSKNKRPIKIGLEYLPDQLPLINRYIESAGLEGDKKALIGSSYWSRQYQDGRTSQAMFNLVEQIRVEQHAGKDVEVFLFDDQSSVNRDKAMAVRIIEELNNDPDTLHVLITGNIHSQITKGVPWDADYMTMGAYVSERKIEFASILLTHLGGSAWICTTYCEETTLNSKEDQSLQTDKGVLKVKGNNNKKHHYHVSVGKINSSIPAYQNLQQIKE